MQIIEDKKIRRIRILYDVRNKNDCVNVINHMSNQFGHLRYVFSVAHSPDPSKPSMMTAEEV